MMPHKGFAGLLGRVIPRLAPGPSGSPRRPQGPAAALEALESRRLMDATMLAGTELCFPPPDPPIPPVPAMWVTAGADASETDPAGAGKGSLIIARTYLTDSALTVNFKLTGTAKRGSDYVVKYNGATLKKNSVTLAAGQASATLEVVPVDDHQAELTESVALTLLPAAKKYVLAAGPTVASIQLTDNEATVSVTKIADAMESGAAGEPGYSGGFRFSRSDTSGALTVYFQRSGTASPGPGGGDYTLSVNGKNVRGNSVVIPDGQSFVDVTVNAVADKRVEAVETLQLALQGRKTYNLDAVAANRTAVVHISDYVAAQALQDGGLILLDGTWNLYKGTGAGGITVDNGGLLLGGDGSVGYAYQYDFTLNPAPVGGCIVNLNDTTDSTVIFNSVPPDSITQDGGGTMTLNGSVVDNTSSDSVTLTGSGLLNIDFANSGATDVGGTTDSGATSATTGSGSATTGGCVVFNSATLLALTGSNSQDSHPDAASLTLTLADNDNLLFYVPETNGTYQLYLELQGGAGYDSATRTLTLRDGRIMHLDPGQVIGQRLTIEDGTTDTATLTASALATLAPDHVDVTTGAHLTYDPATGMLMFADGSTVQFDPAIVTVQTQTA